MDNNFKLVVAALLSGLLAVTAETFQYHDCPPTQGPTGHAASVTLSPCSSLPCTFKHGQTVTVNINFTAGNDTDSLKSTVYGFVAGIAVPYPLPNPDACSNSGIACPVKKGQNYTYTSSFDVLDNYPQIQLVVMWKLDGEKSNDVCFTFPMAISDTEIVG